MEKRKFTINYNNEDTDNKCEKDSYTFVIPNSQIEDIHISVSKDKKKESKNKQK